MTPVYLGQVVPITNRLAVDCATAWTLVAMTSWKALRKPANDRGDTGT